MKAVKVYIWGELAGVVALDPVYAYYTFEYNPKFVQSGIELAPLQMPLRDVGQPFVFTDLPAITYRRLPAMLADALPDDFGNALIDRSMGALEFKPVLGAHAKTPIAIELAELVVLARQAIKQWPDFAHAAGLNKETTQFIGDLHEPL